MKAKGSAIFIMKADNPRRKTASTTFVFFAMNPITMMTKIDNIFSKITSLLPESLFSLHNL